MSGKRNRSRHWPFGIPADTSLGIAPHRKGLVRSSTSSFIVPFPPPGPEKTAIVEYSTFSHSWRGGELGITNRPSGGCGRRREGSLVRPVTEQSASRGRSLLRMYCTKLYERLSLLEALVAQICYARANGQLLGSVLSNA